jgi:hypothetical protein
VMPFQVRTRSPCRDAEPQSKSTKSAASLYLRQHDSPTVDPAAIRRAVISTVRETALTVIFRSRLHEMSKVVCTAIAVRKGNDERTIRGPQGIPLADAARTASVGCILGSCRRLATVSCG